MIDLFEHNKQAYENAVIMLDTVGKAAVIHPTGTGKSFIGFKLCEDNPNKNIIWLSPSDYIFRTQLENLEKVTKGYTPDNISFCTYAKLSLMTDDDINELKADYIILDEFHRCGAEIWGKSVLTLLRSLTDVPILGLSATAIRYLDNQRNMADELFDGNVASEITLGQAIVRGILNPPKYVLSIYSYRKDLERYERRVRNAKSKIVRENAIRYIEALRRNLDEADGLDDIFDKHIADRHGKYIIFTPNYGSMQEYIGKCGEWFWRIDREPHIYKVYSDDPSASREFKLFKEDNSEHLKLLFCIDALNEGIHIDDISGVVLMRPTVSPIIYKQQIGRALSASGTKTPIIFDIVNNIESLYSIDSLREEMAAAIAYYRSVGNSEFVVNETFDIVDKAVECKVLFDKLEETLTASWELMYEKAVEYHRDFGDLDVSTKYITPDGYSLGAWLQTQRRVYSGKIAGELSKDRIAMLDNLGMRWDSFADVSWDKYFTACSEYANKHGDLLPVVSYTTDDGLALGRWIAQIRTFKRSGIKCSYLTEERIAALDKLGMVWEVHDFLFEKFYFACVRYVQEHGDLDVPATYVDSEGVRLGTWITRMRAYYKDNNPALSDDEIERLEALGMIWENKYERLWNTGYEELKKYIEKFGSANVPVAYISESGYKLGAWYSDQLYSYGKGLSQKRIRKLTELGVELERKDPWEEKYLLAKAYFEEHGSLSMPSDYTVNGIWLCKWLSEQRMTGEGKRKRNLTDEQRSKLEALGMQFGKLSKDIAWEMQYEAAKDYFTGHGDLDIPKNYVTKDGKYLRAWVNRQRKAYSCGKLDKRQIELLSHIGMVFEFDDPFEIGFAHAKAYFDEHGSLDVPSEYICEDNYRLGNWISNIRSARKRTNRGSLFPENIDRLNTIGMIWDKREYMWELGYAEAKSYYSKFGSLDVSSKYRTGREPEIYYWVILQRELYNKGKLSDDKIERLNAVGMDWLSPVERAWENTYQKVCAYVRETHSPRIPVTYKNENGDMIGLWLKRQLDKKDRLTSEQLRKLEALGIAI